MTNPLAGWHVERGAIRPFGTGIERPECVLADATGGVWAANGRGGLTRVLADGSGHPIGPCATPAAPGETKPAHISNGFAMCRDGSFAIADFGTMSITRMDRQGRLETLLDEVDGKPLGLINFVLADRRGRLWITVSSRGTLVPEEALLRADGCVVLFDGGRARVVADGFSFTNEIRLDAREEWLYVSETGGRCISRLRVAEDGSLGGRQVFGPKPLGTGGFPDGIAFDAHGNLWCAMVMGEKLIAITPEGEVLTFLDDGDPAAIDALEKAARAGPLPPEVVAATAGPVTRLLTSITFGGPDLRTVYLGSLLGTSLPSFRAPVAGLPMAHWS